MCVRAHVYMCGQRMACSNLAESVCRSLCVMAEPLNRSFSRARSVCSGQHTPDNIGALGLGQRRRLSLACLYVIHPLLQGADLHTAPPCAPLALSHFRLTHRPLERRPHTPIYAQCIAHKGVARVRTRRRRRKQTIISLLAEDPLSGRTRRLRSQPRFARLLGVRCMLYAAACCTPHVARCMLYAACCTLHVVRRMLHAAACCTLHVVCCTLHVVRCMLHAACCTPHVVRRMLYAACCTLHVVRCMLYAACCTPHVVRCLLYAACCALHVARCMLHAACCTLHVVRRMLYAAACCMLHVARCRMLYAACCTPHVVRCMLHAACCTPHVVRCRMLYAACCTLHVVCSMVCGRTRCCACNRRSRSALSCARVRSTVSARICRRLRTLQRNSALRAHGRVACCTLCTTRTLRRTARSLRHAACYVRLCIAARRIRTLFATSASQRSCKPSAHASR